MQNIEHSTWFLAGELEVFSLLYFYQDKTLLSFFPTLCVRGALKIVVPLSDLNERELLMSQTHSLKPKPLNVSSKIDFFTRTKLISFDAYQVGGHVREKYYK